MRAANNWVETKLTRRKEKQWPVRRGLAPASNVAISLNDSIGPALGHFGYKLFRRASDKKQLEESRKRIPLTKLEDRPLVSIRMATFNRKELLLRRAIPSILSQSYQNWELVVVGDHCTDGTGAEIASLGDPRIRFMNLERPTPYPRTRRFKWRAIGYGPWNRALADCRGEWIATLDDDDAFTPDHIESLLDFAGREALEVAYGCAEKYSEGRLNESIGGGDPWRPRIQHSAVMYSARLKFLEYSSLSWLWLESADTNMWYRFRALGARIGFLDRVVTIAEAGGISRPRSRTDEEVRAANTTP